MLTHSLTSSALNLLSTAQQKSSNAAHNIASKSTIETAIKSDFNSNELTTSLIDLKEAELETLAAAKILQTEDDRVGTLFKAIA